MDSEKQTEGFGGEGVEGWVSLVMGIKEGTYCMEHWVWCINNEFWNTEKKIKLKSQFKKKPKLELPCNSAIPLWAFI